VINNYMSTIHILTNIVAAVNAIDDGSVDPVVDVGNEYIYWLDISQRHLGNLIYTEFNKLTGVATRSFSVRYSTAHTVQQVMFSMGARRWHYPEPLMDMFPKWDGKDTPDSSIIPGCYC